MIGTREVWRLTAVFTLLGSVHSYRLHGNSEYFGYEEPEDTFSPSSYYSSQNTPKYSIPGDVDFDSTPVSFMYKSDSPSSSPDPFYIVDDESSSYSDHSGWDSSSPLSTSSVVSPNMRRPSMSSVENESVESIPEDEDEQPNSPISDADILGLGNIEPAMQQIRISPSTKTSGSMPIVMEDEDEPDSGKVVVTMMSHGPGQSKPGASFSRITLKESHSIGSSRLQEGKKSNKQQKVEYFYVDANPNKVSPTFPSFMSKFYRFAELKPGQGWSKNPRSSSNYEMIKDISEFENIGQNSEEPMSSQELEESNGQFMGHEDFQTEHIEPPQKEEQAEEVLESPPQPLDEGMPELLETFTDFDGPSQPTILQEPRQTVLMRPMSLTDNDKRSQSESLSVRNMEHPLNVNTQSLDTGIKSIVQLRQELEQVLQRYQDGLAALSQLERDDTQSQSDMKAPDIKPEYGVPSGSQGSRQTFHKLPQVAFTPFPNQEKNQRRVNIQVRPSINVDHNELSKSNSRADSELLSVIQKLLNNTLLE